MAPLPRAAQGTARQPQPSPYSYPLLHVYSAAAPTSPFHFSIPSSSSTVVVWLPPWSARRLHITRCNRFSLLACFIVCECQTIPKYIVIVAINGNQTYISGRSKHYHVVLQTQLLHLGRLVENAEQWIKVSSHALITQHKACQIAQYWESLQTLLNVSFIFNRDEENQQNHLKESQIAS